MEFIVRKAKGCCEDQEEEEEEEEEGGERIRNNNKNGGWDFFRKDGPVRRTMDLSLRMDSNNSSSGGGSGGENSGSDGFYKGVEREHMFDKVVTPSDVGKLNRLVIPKQHAEKYFPLDSSTHEKGLILNFEDPQGNPWRFRYSYWNSSQSYVMTKGWSRFVKDKKLHPGDVVSFHRSLPLPLPLSPNNHRLFIDWRRRPHPAPSPAPPPPSPHPLLLRWPSPRHYTLPPPPSTPPPSHHQFNYYRTLSSTSYALEIMPNLGITNNFNNNNSSYYFRPSISASATMGLGPMQQGPADCEGSSMEIHYKASSGGGPTTTAAKRLRLFGVNMECSGAADGEGGEQDLSNGGVSLDVDNDLITKRGKQPLSFNWIPE